MSDFATFIFPRKFFEYMTGYTWLYELYLNEDPSWYVNKYTDGYTITEKLIDFNTFRISNRRVYCHIKIIKIVACIFNIRLDIRICRVRYKKKRYLLFYSLNQINRYDKLRQTIRLTNTNSFKSDRSLTYILAIYGSREVIQQRYNIHDRINLTEINASNLCKSIGPLRSLFPRPSRVDLVVKHSAQTALSVSLWSRWSRGTKGQLRNCPSIATE